MSKSIAQDQDLLSLVHDLGNTLCGMRILHHLTPEPLPESAAQMGLAIQMGLRLLDELKQKAFDADHPAHTNVKLLPLQRRFEDFTTTQAQLEAAYDLRLTLTHDVSPNCTVLSDLTLARQVARNLIANAAAAGAKHIRIHYREEPGYQAVQVVFADDGRGMVGTLELAPPGLDMCGVAIVRDLINRVGGLVSWASRPGIGTWVTIRLRTGPPRA